MERTGKLQLVMINFSGINKAVAAAIRGGYMLTVL